jgi:hypothetical protein
VMSVQVIYMWKTTYFRFSLSHAPAYGTSQRQSDLRRPGQGTSRLTKRHSRATLEPRDRPLGYIRLVSDLRGLAWHPASLPFGSARITLWDVFCSQPRRHQEPRRHQKPAIRIDPVRSTRYLRLAVLGGPRGATSDSGSQPLPLAIGRVSVGCLLSFLGVITEPTLAV